MKQFIYKLRAMLGKLILPKDICIMGDPKPFKMGMTHTFTDVDHVNKCITIDDILKDENFKNNLK